MSAETEPTWFDGTADAVAHVKAPTPPHLEVVASLPPEPALDELEASSEAAQAFGQEEPISLAADLEASADGLSPSFREIAIAEYRRTEAAGTHEWHMAMPEERAAAIAGRIVTVAREADQLEARGYLGPDAMQRYLADMAATYAPLPPDPGIRTNNMMSPAAAGPTWRTLADVPDDPAGPLLFGMLEPHGPTLACAAPGTGKGLTGAYLAVEAQKAGMLPVIFDAERRPREWSRRIAGLGGDRSRVVYIEPPDLPRSHVGRPLWDTAPAIGDIIRAAGGDLLVVDSIMPAVGVGEDRLRSDAQVPYLYVSALDALAVPSLSFGHPPKGQPEGEPFGSFAWVAAMRLTWLGTRAERDGHALRWRPKKRNERGHIPGILLMFLYGDDGRPCSVERADDEESTRDWILAGLIHGPRGAADLAEELLGELEDAPPGELERIRERLSRALQRMKHEGWVVKFGKAGRGVQWGLSLTENRP